MIKKTWVETSQQNWWSEIKKKAIQKRGLHQWNPGDPRAPELGRLLVIGLRLGASGATSLERPLGTSGDSGGGKDPGDCWREHLDIFFFFF